MPTKTADRTVPERVSLDDGGRPDDAVYVGPALRGWIYRSTQAPVWYRLLPIDEASIELRQGLRSQSPGLDPSLLATTRDWQQKLNGTTWLVASYKSPSPGRSLAEWLTDSNPAGRLKAAAACLRALPDWWHTLAPPVWPLPAEMIVADDGPARLLWFPRGPLPDHHTVFAHGERVLFLSPEVLRSASNVPWDRTTWEAVDRYAIGAGVLGSYCQLPSVPRAEAALFRAASGSLLGRLPPRSDLPPWLERFSHHRNTVALVRRLTAPTTTARTSVDLKQLADRLDRVLELFDPHSAVTWLRDRAQPEEALNLLQEVFPLAETLGIDLPQQYDLLCLAGELCAKYLSRPLDAVDFYERAMRLDQHRPLAYEEQIRVIANARHHAALAALLESSSTIATEVDVKLWRNYRALVPNRTTHADDESEQVVDHLIARYLLWRRQFEIARDFIYPRLTDAGQTYIWWDFELNLAYVQSFLGLETGDGTNLDRAAEQLQLIKNGLQHVLQTMGLDPALIHQYGEEVSELECRIHDMRSRTR